MKKTIKKAAAVKTPAKKAVAVEKKAAAPVKKAAGPAKKKSTGTPATPVTVITAQIDIGFGNSLFIRGSGPGLSWDKGVLLDCVGTGLWTIALTGATAPVPFKVLVNDLSWSSGEDFVAEPGQSLTISPTF